MGRYANIMLRDGDNDEIRQLEYKLWFGAQSGGDMMCFGGTFSDYTCTTGCDCDLDNECEDCECVDNTFMNDDDEKSFTSDSYFEFDISKYQFNTWIEDDIPIVKTIWEDYHKWYSSSGSTWHGPNEMTGSWIYPWMEDLDERDGINFGKYEEDLVKQWKDAMETGWLHAPHTTHSIGETEFDIIEHLDNGVLTRFPHAYRHEEEEHERDKECVGAFIALYLHLKECFITDEAECIDGSCEY